MNRTGPSVGPSAVGCADIAFTSMGDMDMEVNATDYWASLRPEHIAKWDEHGVNITHLGEIVSHMDSKRIMRTLCVNITDCPKV